MSLRDEVRRRIVDYRTRSLWLVIVRSCARLKRLATAFTDEPIYNSGVLSIQTPCPPFCDVIFVLEQECEFFDLSILRDSAHARLLVHRTVVHESDTVSIGAWRSPQP